MNSKNCCNHEIASWHCDTCQKDLTLEEVLKTSNSVLPSTYIGDWIIDGNLWKPQATCKVGDIVYVTASRPSGNTDDQSMIWAFNISRAVNTIVEGFPKQFKLGHANSICYDENEQCFYIATALMYSGNNNTIFKFDKDFNALGSIECPFFVPLGVSFDHINKVTYTLGISGGTNYHLARISHDEFIYEGKFVLEQPSQVIGEFIYNQDFAVHDDLIVISSPYGAMAVGSIKRKEIYTHKTIATTDLESARWLGELEGMEFDNDGILYAARDTKLTFTSNDVDMMVTVINYKELMTRPVLSFESNDFTFNINDNTVRQFRNWYADLKHPNQINMFATKDTCYKININTTYPMKILSFGVPVGLVISRLNCEQIRFRTGNNYIMPGMENAFMNFSNSSNPIALEDGAQFSLDNNNNYHFNTNLETLNVAVGYQHPIISLGVRLFHGDNAIPVTIGNQEITNPLGLYWRHRLIITEE